MKTLKVLTDLETLFTDLSHALNDAGQVDEDISILFKDAMLKKFDAVFTDVQKIKKDSNATVQDFDLAYQTIKQLIADLR